MLQLMMQIAVKVISGSSQGQNAHALVMFQSIYSSLLTVPTYCQALRVAPLVIQEAEAGLKVFIVGF